MTSYKVASIFKLLPHEKGLEPHSTPRPRFMKLISHAYPSPPASQDVSSSETALPKAANVDLATMPDLLMPGPDMERGLPGACNHRHDPDWFVIILVHHYICRKPIQSTLSMSTFWTC